jgi:hypothetical protein
VCLRPPALYTSLQFSKPPSSHILFLFAHRRVMVYLTPAGHPTCVVKDFTTQAQPLHDTWSSLFETLHFHSLIIS